MNYRYQNVTYINRKSLIRAIAMSRDLERDIRQFEEEEEILIPLVRRRLIQKQKRGKKNENRTD